MSGNGANKVSKRPNNGTNIGTNVKMHDNTARDKASGSYLTTFTSLPL
jgi:hypothetical protein